MNAAQALKAARDAGITLAVAGDKLTLKADAKPSSSVLDMLERHKAEIISYLRSTKDGWPPDDWIAHFDERAGIAEFDGGLSRAEATALAFECCITEWLDRNPVRSSPGRCIGCGLIEASGDPVIPFGTDQTGHAWLHSGCWPAWRQSRLTEARAALERMGIKPDGAKALNDKAGDVPR